MIKAKNWNGKALKGRWDMTIKVDGVRMLRDEKGNPVSRSGKPLYNLDHVPDHITDAEIYLKDWETSVSMVRTKNADPVPLDCVYSLDPVDKRLYWGYCEDPEDNEFDLDLQDVLARGYEGLIIRNGDKWLKIKPKETHDVVVTGMVEGTGKHEGRLGALITPMGKVGTGFNDYQRELYWDTENIVGQTIEVDCMSLTKDGKFRHPRFVRVRWDKDESIQE